MEPTAPVPPTPEDSEGGVPIVRTGPDAELLRHRIERVARFGGYTLGLLGAVTASAGGALWITTRSLVSVALGLFGGVLIFLGVVQYLLYQRDRAHWPDQAILWNDGVELVLHNGEVRGATWADSDLAMDLVDRRAPSPADREYLLVWMMDSKIPPVELSAEGFARLTQATVDRHLHVIESRRGSHSDATKLVVIRQGSSERTPDAGQVAATPGPE